MVLGRQNLLELARNLLPMKSRKAVHREVSHQALCTHPEGAAREAAGHCALQEPGLGESPERGGGALWPQELA